MTPEEARKKMCPRLSKWVWDEDGANTFAIVKCKADDCMAWKWEHFESDGHCGLIRREQ